MTMIKAGYLIIRNAYLLSESSSVVLLSSLLRALANSVKSSSGAGSSLACTSCASSYSFKIAIASLGFRSARNVILKPTASMFDPCAVLVMAVGLSSRTLSLLDFASDTIISLHVAIYLTYSLPLSHATIQTNSPWSACERGAILLLAKEDF